MSDLISDWHNWKWVRCSGPAEFGPEGCPACEIKRLTAEVERTEERRLNLARRGVAKYVTELAEKDKRIKRLETLAGLYADGNLSDAHVMFVCLGLEVSDE